MTTGPSLASGTSASGAAVRDGLLRYVLADQGFDLVAGGEGVNGTSM